MVWPSLDPGLADSSSHGKQGSGHMPTQIDCWGWPRRHAEAVNNSGVEC